MFGPQEIKRFDGFQHSFIIHSSPARFFNLALEGTVQGAELVLRPFRESGARLHSEDFIHLSFTSLYVKLVQF